MEPVTTAVVTVIALIAGPVLAVWASDIRQHRRERDKARRDIFRALMKTRPAQLSPDHVEALNLIDIEFDGKKYEAVRLAWKAYRDHLNTPNPDNPSAWVERQGDRQVELLGAMAAALGYPFDRVDLRKSWYRPLAYGTLESEQNRIRVGVLALLEGRSAIRVAPADVPGDKPPADTATPILADRLPADAAPRVLLPPPEAGPTGLTH